MELDWIEIKRILAGSASEQDVARFNAWLSESAAHRVQFEKMKNYYDNCENEEYIRSVTRDSKYSPLAIIKKSKKIKRNLLLRRGSSVAALILLLFGIKFLYDYTPEKKMEVHSVIAENRNNSPILITDERGEVVDTKRNSRGVSIDEGTKKVVYDNSIADEKIEFHTLHVPQGETYLLELADGTTVKVNANSELKYPTKFKENQPRNIYLKGEAYFDVMPNPKQQFIVSVEDINIKVYGTKFNINSYKEIETVLLSGSVAVEIKGVETKILPNQKATVNRENETMKVENVIAEDYVMWSKNHFTFNDRRLEEIAVVLSKWYNVEIKFRNEDLKELIINCNLPKYEKIETFLESVKKTNHIKYECVNSTYFIY